MTRAHDRLRGGIAKCGVLLLVVVSLPLLAVAAILLRGVLLVAAVAVLLTAPLVYCVLPGFRCWVSRVVDAPGSHGATRA